MRHYRSKRSGGRRHLPIIYEGMQSVGLFWNVLTYFFPSEVLDQWKSAGLGDKAKSPVSMLCLSASAHQYWVEGILALSLVKPSWQAPDPVLNFGNDAPGNEGGIKLWNCRTEHTVTSGDLIILRTDDPAEYPLPDWDLLEMQWYLQMIAAISGAREGGDSESEDDLSDDDTEDSDEYISDCDDLW